MTSQEMWEKSNLKGEYQAWAFGEVPDKLAELVKSGEKVATSSAFALYEIEGEPIPKEGDYSVILSSKDEAVCIIKTTKVDIKEFCMVSKEFAYKEGEGDKSLSYWRKVHEDFFRKELSFVGMDFSEHSLVVCEEFKVVF